MKKTLWWNLNNSLPSLYRTRLTAENNTSYLYNFYRTPGEQGSIKHSFAIQWAAKGTSIKFTLVKFTIVIVSLSLLASVTPPRPWGEERTIVVYTAGGRLQEAQSWAMLQTPAGLRFKCPRTHLTMEHGILLRNPKAAAWKVPILCYLHFSIYP